MTVKEHLSEMHSHMHRHHLAKAASHAARATHFKTLAAHLGKADEAKTILGASIEALAHLHDQMHEEHSQMAEYHADSAAKCAKSVDAEDLTKRDDDATARISGVTPDVQGKGTITPVPRFGQKPMGAREAIVNEQFKKLLVVDEDEEAALRSAK